MVKLLVGAAVPRLSIIYKLVWLAKRKYVFYLSLSFATTMKLLYLRHTAQYLIDFVVPTTTMDTTIIIRRHRSIQFCFMVASMTYAEYDPLQRARIHDAKYP